MTTKKDRHDHVVMHNPSALEPGGFACLHCGATHALAYPIAIDMMIGTSEVFTKLHKGCVPRPNPITEARAKATALEPTTPWDWIRGADTGLSSITIWTVLNRSYFPDGKEARTPLDPSDFGRCYRLVKRIAGWEARLPEVSAKYPEWKPIVDNWDKMCALYEAEYPTGSGPRLYAFMRELGL